MKKKIMTTAITALMLISLISVFQAGTASAIEDSVPAVELQATGDGTAEWSTEKVYTGSYSVKLYAADWQIPDAAAVGLPVDVPLNQITELSYWKYIESFDYVEGEQWGFNPLVILGIDANGDGVLDFDIKDAMLYSNESNPQLGNDAILVIESTTGIPPYLTEPDTDWGKVDALVGDPENPDYPLCVIGFDKNGYLDEVYHWADFTGFGLIDTTDDVKLVGLALDCPSNQTVYVDDLTINDATYSLEPRVINENTGAGYDTIQAAIDNASSGDTVLVYPGTYNEALWIEKSLTMLSTSGAADTIIDGTGVTQERGAHVKISASDVTFGLEGAGFTVKGGANYNLLLTKGEGLAEATYERILIEGNTFEGPCRPFATSGGAYTANLIGVTVSKNTLCSPPTGTYIDIGTDWRLINNTLEGSWFTLTGSSAGIVSGNTFVEAGVSLAQSSDFVINRNSFSGETWDGSYIHVWSPCDPSTFDATLNWWSTTDPVEIKEKILVDVPEVTVSYSPWLGSTVGTIPMTFHVDNTGTIQAAIDAASPGDTVLVAAGTYEAVEIDKKITLQGAGKGSTIISTEAAWETGITITVADDSSDKLVIRDLSVEAGNSAISVKNPGTLTNLEIIDCDMLSSTSNAFQHRIEAGTSASLIDGMLVSGTTFQSDKEHGMSFTSPISNLVIEDSVISNCGAGAYGMGISFWETTINNILIRNTDMSNNKQLGLVVYAEGNGFIVSESTITNNDAGIWLSGITGFEIHYSEISGNTRYDLSSDLTETVDATLNWWGTTDGSAIGTMVSGNVDYTPWFATENPSEEVMNVELIREDTIAWSETIQAAIDAAEPGDTVLVKPGTYEEGVVIDKPLTLRGENRETTEIKFGYGGYPSVPPLTISADGVTVSGFTIRSGPYIEPSWTIVVGGNSTLLTDLKVVKEPLKWANDTPKIAGAAVLVSPSVDGFAFTDSTVDSARNGVYAREGCSNITVRNVDFTYPGEYAVLLKMITGATIEGNTFTCTKAPGSFGVTVTLGSDDIKIVGNQFVGYDKSQVRHVGILLQKYATGDMGNVDISGNDINDFNIGVEVEDVATSGILVNFNNIVGNTCGVKNLATTKVDATLNWWGDPSGPSGVGSGFGDVVSDYVDYTPWFATENPSEDVKNVELIRDKETIAWSETIQAAIDAASSGDTIEVAAGIYKEHIVIDKSNLSLIGEDRETTIIDATPVGGAEEPGILINGYPGVGGITVSGFTIGGAVQPGGTASLPGAQAVTGILIYNGDNNVIENNILVNNLWHVFVCAEWSTAGSKYDGSSCKNNRIANNIMRDSEQDGVYLYSDGSVFVEDTEIINNKIDNAYGEQASGVDFWGWKASHSDSDPAITGTIVRNNDITNCTYGVRIKDVSDITGTSINYNNIAGNEEYGVLNTTKYKIDATYNWWGHPRGPRCGKGKSGRGDRVSEKVLYRPWLTKSFQTVSEEHVGHYGFEGRHLGKGWNTLSVPIYLDNNAWGDIAACLNENIAYRFDASTQKWESMTAGDKLDPLDAIYIKMNSENSVPLVVSVSPRCPPEKELKRGWNLVGLAVWEAENMPVDQALVSVEQTPNGNRGYTIVVSPSLNQKSWTYTISENEKPLMHKNKSYWVYMENPDNLAGFSTTPLPFWEPE